MYTGEVTVPTANILRFMEAARELKIEGLYTSSQQVSPQPSFIYPSPDVGVSHSKVSSVSFLPDCIA